MDNSAHPAAKALSDAGATLLSWPTVVAVAGGAAISLGLRGAGATDVAGPVFGGEAAFVALIVPAASLVNNYLSTRLPNELESLLQRPHDLDSAENARRIASHVDDVFESVRPLLQGFLFLVIGLFLSTGGLFHIEARLWNGTFAPRVGDLLVGEALGFALVGVLLMFPFAWLLLDRELVRGIQKFVHDEAEIIMADAVTVSAAAVGRTTPTSESPPRHTSGSPDDTPDR